MARRRPKRQYTGQISETGIGLYYFNARWYDSSLSRFTTADTIIPGVGDVQVWDRYTAMLNNPVRWVDPTGHKAEGMTLRCLFYFPSYASCNLAMSNFFIARNT